MQLALQDRRKLPDAFSESIKGRAVGMIPGLNRLAGMASDQRIPMKTALDRLKVLRGLRLHTQDLGMGLRAAGSPLDQQSRNLAIQSMKKSRAGRNVLRQVDDRTTYRTTPLAVREYLQARNIRVDPRRLKVDPESMVYRGAGDHRPTTDKFFSAYPLTSRSYTAPYEMQQTLGNSTFARYRRPRFERFPEVKGGVQKIDHQDLTKPFYTHHAAKINPMERLQELSHLVKSRGVSAYKLTPKEQMSPSAIGYETILSPRSAPRGRWMTDQDQMLIPVKPNTSTVRQKYVEQQTALQQIIDRYRPIKKLASADGKITSHDATLPDGRKVDVLRLIEILTNRPTERRLIEDLSSPGKSTRSGFSRKRLELADVRHPLIITPGGRVIDGRHRFHKLKASGRHSVEVQIAEDEDLDGARLDKPASDLTFIHRSSEAHPELRPLTYDELKVKRSSGEFDEDQAAQYVRERRKYESKLRRRLAQAQLASDPAKTFLYATIKDHERMEQFGHEHQFKMEPDELESSFFDVIGDGRERLVRGSKGLKQALKRWADAQDKLEVGDYMGMRIDPRIEVITQRPVKPTKILQTYD